MTLVINPIILESKLKLPIQTLFIKTLRKNFQKKLLLIVFEKLSYTSTENIGELLLGKIDKTFSVDIILEDLSLKFI